jgi:hypothetical protein
VLGLDHREEGNRAAITGVIAPFAGLRFELDGAAALCARFVRAARALPGGGGWEGTVAPKFAVGCHVEALAAGAAEPLSPRAAEPLCPGAAEPLSPREAEPLSPPRAAEPLCRGAAEPLSPRAAEPLRSPRAGIAWTWCGGEGSVSTRYGHARVTLEAGRFAARIAVRDEPLAAHFLLSGLAALVLHRLGGGILHAASVELDSGVVAFVGPSGAGKSTACLHAGDCPLFSVDTLAVVPGPIGPAGAGVWFAHPLPGGTRPLPDMAASSHRWLPLRGVLRVHRSTDESSASAVSPASAVALLRESAFQIGDGRDAELELLAGLERLARAVPIGRLYLRLGASLKPILGRWLVDQGRPS